MNCRINFDLVSGKILWFVNQIHLYTCSVKGDLLRHYEPLNFSHQPPPPSFWDLPVIVLPDWGTKIHLWRPLLPLLPLKFYQFWTKEQKLDKYNSVLKFTITWYFKFSIKRVRDWNFSIKKWLIMLERIHNLFEFTNSVWNVLLNIVVIGKYLYTLNDLMKWDRSNWWY